MDEEQLGFLDELLGVTKEEEQEPEGGENQPEVDGQVEEAQTLGEGDESGVGANKIEESEEEGGPEEDIATTLREQIRQLTEQLNKDPLQQTVKRDVQDGEQKTDLGKTQKTIEAFLTAEELDRVIDEPQLINQAFNRALGSIEQSMQIAIQSEVNRQVMVSKAVSDFYQTNEDLIPYSGFVQFVMGEIERGNPTKTYGEIFQDTAKEARKRLGLGVKTQVRGQQGQAKTQKPAFAGSKKGNSRPAAQQSYFDPAAADMF
jgi:hypothetical protein